MTVSENRLSRRSLLKRAGLAAAAVGFGGGIALGRLGQNGDTGLDYLPGFNDDFIDYSVSSFADATMAKVRACGGRCVRTGVDWGHVQPDGPESYDWSAFAKLRSEARRAGVEVLPTIGGCPEWAGPVMTAGRRDWPGSPYPPGHFRTCSPAHDDDFGRFADAAIRYFDENAVSDGPAAISAVEITNEPNTWTFGAVPAARISDLANAAVRQVGESQSAGSYSRPMRVVSGGLAPVSALGPGNPAGYPARQSWQEYLAELVGTAPPEFDVGFHSYELSKPPAGTLSMPEDNPVEPYARAREFAVWQAAQIVGLIDQALEITGQDIWVTETGASSASTWSRDIFSPEYRFAHGQEIQAEVLSGVANALKARKRCRAMLVHRLFSDEVAEPPPSENRDSAYYQYGVYDSTNGRPKLAVAALAQTWS